MKTIFIAVLMGVLGSAWGQSTATFRTFFSDDFESGNISKWTATTTPLVIDNTQNREPIPGTYSAKLSKVRDRMHRNIIGDNNNQELRGHFRMGYYMYVSPNFLTDTNYRGYGEIRGYSRKGLPNGGQTPDGSLLQLFAAGVFNTNTMPGEVYDSTRFQGRVSSAVNAGWFNLTVPRSPGWHLFEIERLPDETTVNFYVDGILGRTIYGCRPESMDCILVGNGTNADDPMEVWFDGINVSVETTPPVVDMAYGSFSFNEVTVLFSEPVNETADNPANYTIPGLEIQKVTRMNSGAVKLGTTAHTPGQLYVIQVSGIEDTAKNLMPVPSLEAFQAFTVPTFATSFDGQPAGTQVHGAATVHHDVLKLTINEDSLYSSFVINDLNAGQKIAGFTAVFKARLGGGSSTPADGFSFCLGPDLPNGPWSEDGAGTGFKVCFDSYNNLNGEAPAIELRHGDTVLATKKMRTLRTGDTFGEVLIQVSPSGLVDLAYNGVMIFHNVPGYPVAQNGRFGFGARTGGANENQWIDDLIISTLSPNIDNVPPSVTRVCSDDTLTNVFVVFSEPVGSSAGNKANYTASGGLTILTARQVNDYKVKLETSPQTPLSTYTVSVTQVQDRAPVPNTIAANASGSFKAHDITSTFFTDFCELPYEGRSHSSALIQNGVLQLTQGFANQAGTFILDDFDAGKRIIAFDVSFLARIGGGTTPPGEGFSLNFGSGYPVGAFGSAEEGTGNGISVCFDSTDSAIHIKFAGTQIASKSVASLDTGNGFVPVKIVLDTQGRLSVTWNNVKVHDAVPVLEAPIAGAFSLAGRTSGSTANHWIDDLRIITEVLPPDEEPPVLTFLVAPLGAPENIYLTFSEPILASTAGKVANYVLDPAVTITSGSLDATGTTIHLITQTPLEAGVNYTLTIRDLTDRANTLNDLGPNPIAPNPTVVSFQLGLVTPSDVGTMVEGFQDDFSTSERNSGWVPVGTGGDVYTVDPVAGVLKVVTADGENNHLVYRGSNYDRRNQEVLARVRVTGFGTGDFARAGIATTVNSSGLGQNFLFADTGSNRDFRLLNEQNASTIFVPFTWGNDNYYWLRMRTIGLVTEGKVWPADGVEFEPEEWNTWNHQFDVSGDAGITASILNGVSQFEVDYILIKAAGLPVIQVDPEVFRGPDLGDDCGSLTIQRAGEMISVSWTSPCRLQWTEDLRTEFTDVPGNPLTSFTTEVSNAPKYFRLRSVDP